MLHVTLWNDEDTSQITLFQLNVDIESCNGRSCSSIWCRIRRQGSILYVSINQLLFASLNLYHKYPDDILFTMFSFRPLTFDQGRTATMMGLVEFYRRNCIKPFRDSNSSSSIKENLIQPGGFFSAKLIEESCLFLALCRTVDAGSAWK